MTSEKTRRILRRAIPIVILITAVGVARILIATRPGPRKAPVREMVTLVEVMRAEPSRDRVIVEAMGTVVPAREILLQAEVGGRVVWRHEDLVPGGRLERGVQVVRIDPRDYELAVEQQKGALERASVELDIEKSRGEIAAEEWALLGDEAGVNDSGRSLALREPQLRAAESAYTAARSALHKAELGVERTVVRCPFNSLVLDKSVDSGQLVSPQTRIASLVGTDEFWVRASVAVRDLHWIRLPDCHGCHGSPARVVQDTGDGRTLVRTGRVVRLYGDLEPAGRMARVLISVPNPLDGGPAGNEDARLPLLLGSYVSAEMEGLELEDVFRVPRSALREGNSLWIMDPADRLAVRKVEILWERGDTVEIGAGLSEGDRVVTSRISVPVPGMKIRVAVGPAPKAHAAGNTAPERGEVKAGRNRDGTGEQ
ncbi:efflux RND transporter periplasmic adaptor subunit [Verrucomicrobiota bacterium]